MSQFCYYDFVLDLVLSEPKTYLWHPKRQVWSQGPNLVVELDGRYKGDYEFWTTVLNGTALLLLGIPLEENSVFSFDTVYMVNLPFNIWERYPSPEILKYSFGGKGVVMTFDKSGHR